tara:strand:+ start:3174 stop:3347 length:174 start_codon:yes stop_codon:yes gene_type:complete
MKKQSDILLSQIIEHAELVDERDREKATREHQSERTVGESWFVHHLKLLKRSLEDDR